ncbi:MAG: fructosamine kinase family protein [Candidatus Thermoplasmatota archaeon]|nr:fructosamine kinase family protein [Candidatus Thermoplasmatota archaeon]
MSAFHNELAAAISRSSGLPFTAQDTRAMHGGDISEAFTLSDGARTFFVKTQSGARLAMFEAEAAGLAELAAADAVRVPQVLCHGIAAGQAYLVLEYLPLKPHGDAVLLGRQLAQQHRVGAAQFGGARDNWIGATPQPNACMNDWVDFWREQRLGFQLRLAAGNGYGGTLRRDGEALMARLDGFFAGYRPVPSLLHGDLWGGNHGFLDDGSYDLSCPSGHRKSESPCGAPVIFDPAVYYGDRECDLAMSELFGGFAPDFYAAYREAWPLDPGYAVRRTLYNLYHILNHANLFGGGYAAQAHRMMAQLLAELR